jgi:cyanoexosortase B-associated protein
MNAFSLPKSLRSRIIPRIAVVCFLSILIAIGAVPGYLTGNWLWKQPPPVANLNQLRNLRQTGLTLPDSKTVEQKIGIVGGHKWSIQVIERDYPKPIRLLLLPQTDNKSQPQVEWVDMEGSERWKTDSYGKIQFEVKPSKLTAQDAKVETRFFRAWNQRQTFAVLQWYAWPSGGHPAPSRWFWIDQLAQLHRDRVPWVAVCLQIPIEPLGDLEAARPLAESLAKMVQTALMTGPLAKT